jgi:hypothetical protein
MFTLQTRFQPLLLKGAGGEVKSVVEVTVNSKEENSEYFCPKYIKEFGLWALLLRKYFKFCVRSSSFGFYVNWLLLLLIVSMAPALGFYVYVPSVKNFSVPIMAETPRR